MPVSIGRFSRPHRALGEAGAALNRAIERLATGKRINRGADDPSGLIASEGLKADITVIEKKLRALDRNAARLGVFEGGLSVQSDLVIELQGLVTRAGNRDVLGDAERDALQQQVGGIIEGLGRVDQTISLTTGGYGTGFGTSDLAALAAGGDANLVDGDLEKAQSIVGALADGINTRRAVIGDALTRYDSQRDALLVERENLASANSVIEDADIAREAAEKFRAELLREASIAAILIERTTQEAALDLLAAAVGGRGG